MNLITFIDELIKQERPHSVEWDDLKEIRSKVIDEQERIVKELQRRANETYTENAAITYIDAIKVVKGE